MHGVCKFTSFMVAYASFKQVSYTSIILQTIVRASITIIFITIIYVLKNTICHRYEIRILSIHIFIVCLNFKRIFLIHFAKAYEQMAVKDLGGINATTYIIYLVVGNVILDSKLDRKIDQTRLEGYTTQKSLIQNNIFSGMTLPKEYQIQDHTKFRVFQKNKGMCTILFLIYFQHRKWFKNFSEKKSRF